MFEKVILLSNGKEAKVYKEEASFLIGKGLAVYPEDFKAIEPAYENKMIDPVQHNKRGRKPKQ